MNLVTLMPTRGRAERAWQAFESHEKTKTHFGTTMVAVLDAEDGGFELYAPFLSHRFYVTHGNMVERTNKAVHAVVNQFDVVGWTADDQIFRTTGWDFQVLEQFKNPDVGFVMTNDLHYGPARPVNIYTRPSIIKALGWLAYPKLEHLYVDNVWYDLGTGSGSMVYLEDVVVEHMHPVYGKAEFDPQYHDLHQGTQYARDGAAYDEWRANHMADDIRKVKACLGRS